MSTKSEQESHLTNSELFGVLAIVFLTIVGFGTVCYFAGQLIHEFVKGF